ncbi:yodL-like family protein [Clostridioides difficile F665]|nr:yodL-like family protein [Clostridioides difficile F665]
MAADTDGYFSADHQKIAIRQGMSEVQTVSATVHEIAHSKLHDPKKYEMLPSWKIVLESEGGTKHDFKLDFATEREAEQFASDMDWRYVDENQFEWRLAVEEDPTAEKQAIKNRHTEEVEAESISYAVCKYFGIETGENSFGYIASWSQGKELKELRASLETINKTSGTLLSDIERHYKEICKERGIDPNTKAEPETAPIEQPTGNLTYYVAECMEFPNLGEYHDNLSLEEAVRIYQEIPAERMNGIKGIGFELKDGSDYEGPFPILTGQTIDLDTIQAIDYYRDNPLVQKAVKELAAAMPEMEVLGADANQQEALFLIDDATYLHIQPCDSGWDYTLYDVASMKELDGGQLDMPELSRMKAVLQICDDNDLDRDSVKYAPLSMIETLQEAAYQQMQAEASQMAASSQLLEAQEQALDEYPMPDEQVSTPDMQEYGYSYDGMLPVTRERALELDAAGLTVYVLHEDNTESMVFDPQEIMEHGGLCGVDREEWEKSPQFHEKVMERQEHQQEREQAFLSQNRDCFAIYQVTRDDPQNVRFMNLDWLKSHDISIDRSNYDLIYTAPLSESGTVLEQLEKLYQQFNLEKPVDYHSPSMSVSDIVAIKQDGKVSCHYCDSVGFTQIPGFFSQNPLKNAEMTVEDDYGMIDGIINNGAKEPTVAELEQQARSGQPISLMDLADAVHREEREKKKSVVDQLKRQPKAEHKKTAPKKSAEREI